MRKNSIAVLTISCFDEEKKLITDWRFRQRKIWHPINHCPGICEYLQEISDPWFKWWKSFVSHQVYLNLYIALEWFNANSLKIKTKNKRSKYLVSRAIHKYKIVRFYTEISYTYWLLLWLDWFSVIKQVLVWFSKK